MNPIVSDGMPAEAFHALFEPQAQTVADPIDTGLGIEPGIHFGLSDDVYHALPALSASGMKNLLISPMLYWAEGFLNPNRRGSGDSDALELGRAYHARVCEGSSPFYERYGLNFDKGDYPSALDTIPEITARLKELDVKGYSGKKKSELVEILLSVDPEAVILDIIRDDYEASYAGKRLVSAWTIQQVEVAARMIELDPAAQKCFAGGYPEVSVIWHDPATGVPMKARFDYLKIGAICDLKSFSNPLGKPIDKAIYGAMASRKYHLQAAVYLEADRHAAKAVKEGRIFLGPESPSIPQDWLDKYAGASEQRRFVFVFQQTGNAPLTRVREFPRGLVYECGLSAMRDAQRKFAEFWANFGRDQWLDLAPMAVFSDDEFPNHTVEL